MKLPIGKLTIAAAAIVVSAGIASAQQLTTFDDFVDDFQVGPNCTSAHLRQANIWVATPAAMTPNGNLGKLVTDSFNGRVGFRFHVFVGVASNPPCWDSSFHGVFNTVQHITPITN